jgi:hypothetical protein
MRTLIHPGPIPGVHVSLINLCPSRWGGSAGIRRGQARGWLWQAGALQRFRWCYHSGQLSLHEQLHCITTFPLQHLT